MASPASCFLTLSNMVLETPIMFRVWPDPEPNVLFGMLLDAAAANHDFCRLVGVDPADAPETFKGVTRFCEGFAEGHRTLWEFLCEPAETMVDKTMFNSSRSPFDHEHAFVYISAAVAANPTITNMHLTAYSTPRPCPVLFLTRDSLTKLRISYDVSCVSVANDRIMRGLSPMRKLQSIELVFTASDRNDLPLLDTAIHDAVALLTRCAPPSLTKLRIFTFDSGVPQLPLRWITQLPATLQHIKLFVTVDDLLDQGLVDAIADSCPGLQSLTYIQRAWTLSPEQCVARMINQMFSKRSMPVQATQQEPSLSRLLRCLADRLRRLTLSCSLNNTLVAAIKSMHKLRNLDLRYYPDLSTDVVFPSPANLPRHSALESLWLSNFTNHRDANFASIIRHIANTSAFPKLADIRIIDSETFGTQSTVALSKCLLRHGAVQQLEIPGGQLQDKIAEAVHSQRKEENRSQRDRDGMPLADKGLLVNLVDGLRATAGSLQNFILHAPLARLQFYQALSETLAQCPTLRLVCMAGAKFIVRSEKSYRPKNKRLSDYDKELASVLTPLISTLHLGEVFLSLDTSRPLLSRRENMPASSEVVARLMRNRVVDSKHRAAWEVVRTAICRMQERRVTTGRPLHSMLCRVPSSVLRFIGEFTGCLKVTPFILY